MRRSRSYIATPPGATIKEQLVDRGMSQKEFAARMNMSEKHISHLINGDVQLTPEVAYKLEMVLGISASFWNNLEAIYREKLAKVDAENALDADMKIAKKFPYSEMAKNKWLPDTRKPAERTVNLRRFFEVTQLQSLVDDSLLPNVACRRLSISEKADFALIAWVQKAKLEARKIQTNPINIKELEERIPEIRAMTKKEPDIFCEELRALLANCGIAVVFLPHIGGSFLHGATFVDNNKIVVGMTVRGRDADRFWFSLFHEIGHILLGHFGRGVGTIEEKEKMADIFARDSLIPQEEFRTFTSRRDFSRGAIIRFAKGIGVASGIVVGRLQKEGYIDFSWYNDLKERYSIAV